MGRNILAAIVGYVAMFVVVFVTFSVAFMIIGVERSYQSGSYEVSMLWILVSLVLSLAAALVGGCVCKSIAKNDTAVKMLAGFVLVLGLVMAIMQMMGERPSDPRPADVPVMEAAAKSWQPAWVGFVVTLIGVGGVLYAGRLKKTEAGG